MTAGERSIVWVAQGFGVGKIPMAPGTWGSLLGIGLGLLVVRFLGSLPGLLLACAVLSVAVSIFCCGEAARLLQDKDPYSVVLDEIVAVPFCFVAAALLPFFPWNPTSLPVPWLKLMAALSEPSAWLFHFALFRLFDIWKPWPIRQSQQLPGGWGIVLDDLLAAVYVNLVVFGLYALARYSAQ